MKSFGKTGLAVVVLAALLGSGWWAIQSREGVRPSAVTQAGPNKVETMVARDPEAVRDIETLVRLANDAVLGQANVVTAIALTDLALERIARQPSPGPWVELRQSLLVDRQALILLAQRDIAGLAAQLEAIVADIDRLPLVSAPRPLTQAPRPAAPAQPAVADGVLPSLQSIWSGIQTRFLEVVQIRRVDNPQALFLTPEQGALVVERLRLRLLSARVGLMSRQDKLLQYDLEQSLFILNQAFDSEHDGVRGHRQTLEKLIKTTRELRPARPLTALKVLTSWSAASTTKPAEGKAQ